MIGQKIRCTASSPKRRITSPLRIAVNGSPRKLLSPVTPSTIQKMGRTIKADPRHSRFKSWGADAIVERPQYTPYFKSTKPAACDLSGSTRSSKDQMLLKQASTVTSNDVSFGDESVEVIPMTFLSIALK